MAPLSTIGTVLSFVLVIYLWNRFVIANLGRWIVRFNKGNREHPYLQQLIARAPQISFFIGWRAR